VVFVFLPRRLQSFNPSIPCYVHPPLPPTCDRAQDALLKLLRTTLPPMSRCLYRLVFANARQSNSWIVGRVDAFAPAYSKRPNLHFHLMKGGHPLFRTYFLSSSFFLRRGPFFPLYFFSYPNCKGPSHGWAFFSDETHFQCPLVGPMSFAVFIVPF